MAGSKKVVWSRKIPSKIAGRAIVPKCPKRLARGAMERFDGPLLLLESKNDENLRCLWRNAEVDIQSELPLHFKMNDPRNILKFTEKTNVLTETKVEKFNYKLELKYK